LKGEKMPFIIEEDYLLKIRKGESGTIVFKFNIPLKGFCTDFSILKDGLEKPVIIKTFKDILENILEIKLSSDETDKLSTDEGFRGEYNWNLRLYNDKGFNSIIIPNKLNKSPKLFVYPKIGG